MADVLITERIEDPSIEQLKAAFSVVLFDFEFIALTDKHQRLQFCFNLFVTAACSTDQLLRSAKDRRYSISLCSGSERNAEIRLPLLALSSTQDSWSVSLNIAVAQNLPLDGSGSG